MAKVRNSDKNKKQILLKEWDIKKPIELLLSVCYFGVGLIT